MKAPAATVAIPGLLAVLATCLLAAASGCVGGSEPAATPPAPATSGPAPASGAEGSPSAGTGEPAGEESEPPEGSPPPPAREAPPARGMQTLPPSLVATEWERLPTARKVVALTFDACSNADGAAPILTTLAETRTPATFFLCGRWAEAFPEIAGRMADRYPIGSHTYSHPQLTRLSDEEVRSEVRRGGRALRAVTSADSHPLFRFPFGDRDARTIGLVNDLGYGSIRWTVDTLGWQGKAAGRSAATVVQRVLASLGPGQIVLMHVGSAPDGSTLDADALPTLVAEIRSRGYRFVNAYEYAGRYRQTVDDASARFRASSAWGTSSWNRERIGVAYHYARPADVSDPAQFKLKVPQTARYRVAAWWPSGPDYNAATPIVVRTVEGRRRVRVDQQTKGARWVKLGTFTLRAGDSWTVRIPQGTEAPGLVIADAVRITNARRH